MKLGCLFKTFAIIIVLLGTSFYLYNKYGKDIIEQTTEHAKELAIEQIEKIVNNVSETAISKPIKTKVEELLNDLNKKKDEISGEKFEDIISQLKKMIDENRFDEKSLDKIKELIETDKN